MAASSSAVAPSSVPMLIGFKVEDNETPIAINEGNSKNRARYFIASCWTNQLAQAVVALMKGSPISDSVPITTSIQLAVDRANDDAAEGDGLTRCPILDGNGFHVGEFMMGSDHARNRLKLVRRMSLSTFQEEMICQKLLSSSLKEYVPLESSDSAPMGSLIGIKLKGLKDRWFMTSDWTEELSMDLSVFVGKNLFTVEPINSVSFAIRDLKSERKPGRSPPKYCLLDQDKNLIGEFLSGVNNSSVDLKLVELPISKQERICQGILSLGVTECIPVKSSDSASMRFSVPIKMEVNDSKYQWIVTSRWTPHLAEKVAAFMTMYSFEEGCLKKTPSIELARSAIKSARDRVEAGIPFTRYPVLHKNNRAIIGEFTIGFNKDPQKMELVGRCLPQEERICREILNWGLTEYIPYLHRRGVRFPVFENEQLEIEWKDKEVKEWVDLRRVVLVATAPLEYDILNRLLSEIGFKLKRDSQEVLNESQKSSNTYEISLSHFIL